jgi:hypothetical protein
MDGWTQKGFNHILRDWKTESAVSDELKESLAGIETYDQVCLSIPYSGYRCIHMLHDIAVKYGIHSWIGCPALNILAPEVQGCCARVCKCYGALM